MVPSLPLLPCELSVSVKENPDRKKKKDTQNFPNVKPKTEVDFIKKYIENLDTEKDNKNFTKD